MRIAFWNSAALAVLLSAPVAMADDSVPLGSGGTIRCSPSRGKTKLEIRTPEGARYSLRVERDATVSSGIAPSGLELVGEIRGRAIIFIDTYPSLPGGLSYCQAGEERFLRVISIARKPAVETFRVKVESCLQNIELASPGAEWFPESSKLVIHWLQGPEGTQKPAELTLGIRTDGWPE